MKRIFFRADASPDIGYGHFTRTLALADMLKSSFDCYFATRQPTEYQLNEIEQVCKYLYLPNDDSHFEYFLAHINRDDIVVLDNYFFNENYQLAIKKKGCSLVCIDDFNKKEYFSDVLINYAPCTDDNIFKIQPYTKLCTGINYALLRPPFLSGRRQSGQNKLFLCFGGSDYLNLTLDVLNSVAGLPSLEGINVVVGDGYRYTGTLLDIISRYRHVSFYSGIDAEGMADIMSECSHAIVPSSTILFEALSLRLIVASGYYVDNQIEIYKSFRKSGIIYPIGDFRKNKAFPLYIENMKSRCHTLSSANNINFMQISQRYLNLFHSL